MITINKVAETKSIEKQISNLKIFENKEFGSLRTIEIEGEPWFVGKDVAEALGYGNDNNVSKALSNAISKHVDMEDKKRVPYSYFKGHQNSDLKSISHFGMTVINESGLYSLILSSKLPKAKQFKHWVTSEVIPSIRKHGAYMTPETIEKVLLNPDTIITLATALKAEQEKTQQLSEKIEADKPKVEFAEHVASDPYGMRMREFAKVCCDNGIETGEKRLYKFLRDNKYLDKNNIPYQCYIDRGYFKVKEVPISNTGTVKPVTRITGKGQQYFLRKLKESLSV